MALPKLNLELARAIRVRRGQGATYLQLSHEFGVTRTTANRVCRLLAWREPGTDRKFAPREAFKTVGRCEHCKQPFRYWRRRNDPTRRFCSRGCNLAFHKPKNRKLPDVETVAMLYHVKHWSLQRIAIRYGCCFQAVHTFMKRHGIRRRSRVIQS